MLLMGLLVSGTEERRETVTESALEVEIAEAATDKVAEGTLFLARCSLEVQAPLNEEEPSGLVRTVKRPSSTVVRMNLAAEVHCSAPGLG